MTGANRVWIAGTHSAGLPDAVLFPTVTRARELIRSGPVLRDPENLKRVIDLPQDLSALEGDERTVRRFLKQAEKMGAKGELYRTASSCMVVCLAAKTCPDLGNLHGAASASIRAE